MADVVPVADPGQAQAAEVEPSLPQREKVGERLAGVLVVRERIHHRDACVTREIVDGRLRERPGRDDVNPPPEVPGDVSDRLAPPEPDILPREVDGGAAQLRHAHLERHARPERRLLEDEGQRVAGEGRPRLAGPRPGLPVGGEPEDLLDVLGREVGDRQQALHGLGCRSTSATMATARSASCSSTMSGGVMRRIFSPAVRTRSPRSRQASTTAPAGRSRSMPISRPLPRTSWIAGTVAARARSRPMRWDPTRSARSGSRSSSIVVNVATPTVVANGLPPKVVPCVPGIITRAQASRATMAPMGTPLARAFASVMTSGSTPQC